MPDSIDRETVSQVAKLARIHVTDEEAELARQQLSQILDYVGHLNQVELPDDLVPFFGAAETVNAVRPDELQPSFDRQLILENAPDTDGEFYRVPPVFRT